MSTGAKIGLIVVGGLVLAVLLVFGGFVVGRATLGVLGWPMGTVFHPGGWGPGMMGNARLGGEGRGGPAGGFWGRMGGPGGMMSGLGGNRSAFGGGMMGAFRSSGTDPLTLDEAEAALDRYLANLAIEDLQVAEIMIFDNHAYAEIVEESTGIGAMEVLVDPVTLDVFPEPGPNMMWNTKYGHMGARGGGMGAFGGGMMGNGWWWPTGPDGSDMAVTPEEAVALAQAYLDRLGEGDRAADHADRFYGYYTLHIERDGETVGMLSVHGTTGSVFAHVWHGDFIEMAEDHAD